MPAYGGGDIPRFDMDNDQPESLEQELVALVQAILEAKGYTFFQGETPPVMRDLAGFAYGPDILARSPSAREWTVVEIKLYRSDRTSQTLLDNALQQIGKYMAGLRALEGILVVTSNMTSVQRERYRASYSSIRIWDLPELVSQARGHDALLSSAVSEFVKRARIGRSERDEFELAELVDEAAAPPPPHGKGGSLAKELESSSAGKSEKAAKRFENICERAVRLLFGDDFAVWNSQSRTDGAFHRMDLVARIAATADPFWLGLGHDFRSRYVIFEFKNYKEKVRQGEVYTTEKYLFTAAMRSIAIIIARNGSSESADTAMKGSLREQGKLILSISMQELCGLLKGFDVGEDPRNLLIDKLDNMLLKILR
jgi:hypothetical protein